MVITVWPEDINKRPGYLRVDERIILRWMIRKLSVRF
jgi:hypothetical protein